MIAVGPWPQVSTEPHVWHPDPRSRGPIADRLLGQYQSAVVPPIAHQPLRLSAIAQSTCDAAAAAITELQATSPVLSALTGAMLRSESVASSKIERLSAPQRDVALAAFGAAGATGANARETARAVAANMAAMARAVTTTSGTTISRQDVLEVHRLLMADDPVTSSEAGCVRTVQNWIGGSDYSPRDALFVPPHPSALHAAITDLVEFANRNDIDAVAQAAIAHAQFETLHPFSDGNGRSGRAFIHVLWRYHGVAPSVVVPVSTVLLADVDSYFDGLTLYRNGDVEPWVMQFSAAATKAAIVGRALAGEVGRLRETWVGAASARRGSLRSTLIELALRSPVMDYASLQRQGLERVQSSVYRALEQLEADGILVEVTGQGRHRVWIAPAVFELLERFEQEVGRRRLPVTPVR